MRDEFKITRQGKQYVLFAGLLDAAHDDGLFEIDTQLLQIPTVENGNVAIVKAKVVMERSSAYQTYTGLGDASPENVGRNIVPHIIRMAETRAKARALRDAVNVGVAALEELGGEDETPTPQTPRQARTGDSRGSGDESEPVGKPAFQPATTAQIGWLKWAEGEGHIKLDKKAEEYTKREAWQIREKYEKAHEESG